MWYIIGVERVKVDVLKFKFDDTSLYTKNNSKQRQFFSLEYFILYLLHTR